MLPLLYTALLIWIFMQVYKSDSSVDTNNSGKSGNLLEVDKKPNRNGDALSTCDSGSEVSDEGYKSSQGGGNSNR